MRRDGCKSDGEAEALVRFECVWVLTQLSRLRDRASRLRKVLSGEPMTSPNIRQLSILLLLFSNLLREFS